jgi:putative spermidine/putrescine transport system ATP-binding protein
VQRPLQLARLRPAFGENSGSAAGISGAVVASVAARELPALPHAKLVAVGISKSYGTVEVLQPTHLEIAAGELVTILGPSGSGKTTLLQIICGLVEPTAGRLLIDGADQTHTPAHRRDMGVVFQNYALFPHLTVQENVAFPLQMRRVPARELNKKVATALGMVGLAEFTTRFPRELSGGQQQRVALARCLVYQPALILMDEPLGALDRKLRETMQIEIKRLHRDTGATIIFVTHDQEEALALSDRVCLMNAGGVEQVGTPQEIYQRPANTFVADFIGISNVIRGRVSASGGDLVTTDGGLPIPNEMRGDAIAGQSGALVIRPEHVDLGTTGHDGLAGRVIETVYAGAETRVLVALASGTVITVRRSGGQWAPDVGDAVVVTWDRDRARFLAT